MNRKLQYERLTEKRCKQAGRPLRVRLYSVGAAVLLLVLAGLGLGYVRSRAHSESTLNESRELAKPGPAEFGPLSRSSRVAPSQDIKSAATPQNIPVELMTIEPYGFEPNTITRSAGQVLLVVDNRSGVGDLVIHLDKDTGLPIHVQPLTHQKHDFGKLFDLAAGDYVVSEEKHPDWQCRIKVRAN